MASKEEMLSRVRTALGRAGGRAPTPLPAYVPAAPAIDGDMVEAFCGRAEALGARVVSVGSADEIREYVSGLIIEGEHVRVGVSDGGSLGRCGLGEHLSARGHSVLRTLKEFAEGRGEADDDLMESYKRELITVKIGVTSADYAIADTGTLVLISGGEQHRLLSLVPPVHVCLLDASRVVANLDDLLAVAYKEHYSKKTPPLAMTFITGPSRTADIELSLTLGVHGPRELHVLIFDTPL